MKKFAALILFAAVLFPAGLLAADITADESKVDQGNGLVLIDKRGGLVRFLNSENFSEISSLSINGTPHELALSPDRKTAYVPDYGDGVYGNNPNPGSKIAVIDLETRQLRATIDISPYIAPHGVQTDQAGNLYVSCDLSRKLLVINPDTLTITAAIDTEGTGHWLAVLPDGSKAYVANKNDRLFVSVIDLKRQQMVGKIPMKHGTQGITASPDGKLVVAVDIKEPKLHVIDTSSDTVVQQVTIEGNNSAVWGGRFSADSRQLAIVNAREGTLSLLDTSNWQWVLSGIAVGLQPFGLVFAGDPSQLLVANHGDGSIAVVDTNSGGSVKKIQVGVGIETLSFY